MHFSRLPWLSKFPLRNQLSFWRVFLYMWLMCFLFSFQSSSLFCMFSVLTTDNVAERFFPLLVLSVAVLLCLCECVFSCLGSFPLCWSSALWLLLPVPVVRRPGLPMLFRISCLFLSCVLEFFSHSLFCLDPLLYLWVLELCLHLIHPTYITV